MQPIIRTLRDSEIETLQRCMPTGSRLVHSVLRNYHESRLEAQNRGSADYLIAWLDGSPVGHLFLRWHVEEPFLRERAQSGPVVEALRVRDDMRSRGVATALMVEAERMASERGYGVVGLAVGVENERARSLYRRLGYRESGLGEFTVSWIVTDRDAIERTESETCTYLRKELR